MSSNKKPRKKYCPKCEVRAPSIIFRATGEMTEKDHRNIDLMAYVHLDNIRRGEGNETDVIFVQSSIRACFVLAAAFENKQEIQRLCRLVPGSMYAVNRLLEMKEEIEDFLLQPPQALIELHSDMARALDRSTLVRAARANYDTLQPVLKIDTGTGFVVEPDWDPNDETTLTLEGRPGCAYLHGALRHGYVRMIQEIERNEFYDPDDDITVPITDKVTVLLDKPISEKLQKRLAHY